MYVGSFCSRSKLLLFFVFGVSSNICYFIPEIRYLYLLPPPPYVVSLAKCLLILSIFSKNCRFLKLLFSIASLLSILIDFCVCLFFLAFCLLKVDFILL